MQNKACLFWIFSFPILSHIFNLYLTSFQKYGLFYISLSIIILRLLGVQFAFIDLSPIFFIIFCSSVLSILKKETQWRDDIFMSILLLFFSGICYLFLSFIGIIKTEKFWNKDGYRIEQIEERGFSGRAVHTFKLSKYIGANIFLKDFDSKYDIQDMNNCNIEFTNSRIGFDKCKNEITLLK